MRWDDVLENLPSTGAYRVLDLGCGTGETTAFLQLLGQKVTGVELSDELLANARARHPRVDFQKFDLRELEPHCFGPVKGIWASFVAAEFPDLESTLKKWRLCLLQGGWIALAEIDDLLGHTPLPEEFQKQLQEFYRESRSSGRHDFEAGGKLASSLRSAGFKILEEKTRDDAELSFQGRASEEVLHSWRERLRRVAGLEKFFGERFATFENAFLSALASPEHQSTCRVCLVIAVRPGTSLYRVWDEPPLSSRFAAAKNGARLRIDERGTVGYGMGGVLVTLLPESSIGWPSDCELLELLPFSDLYQPARIEAVSEREKRVWIATD